MSYSTKSTPLTYFLSKKLIYSLECMRFKEISLVISYLPNHINTIKDELTGTYYFIKIELDTDTWSDGR